MLRAVFFDLGGTLHTASEGEERAMGFAENVLQVLEKQGIILGDSPAVFYEKLIARSKAYKLYVEKYCVELSPEVIWHQWLLADYDVDPEKLYPVAEPLCCLWDGSRRKHTPREDLIPVLEELTRRGYYLGIISNIISLRQIPRHLERYGVTKYFRQVLTSAGCGMRKPRPEIFTLAYERAGVPASDCVFVGDRYSRDVLGGRRSGTGLVVRIWDKEIPERDLPLLGQVEPDYTIHQLSELLAWLPEVPEDQRL